MSSKHTTKEGRFGHTLHKAEGRQLEHFLKERSSELDKEIAALQGRLGSSAMNISISGRGLTAMDAIETGVKGQSTGASVNFANTSNSPPGPPAGTYLQSDDNTYGKFHSNTVGASAQSNSNLVPTTTSAPVDRSLRGLLQRIALKMDDVMMTPAQMRDMLLPSDLCRPTDTIVSLEELTLFLQTDLVMPIERNEQLMILKNYGNTNGKVDAKLLLSAAGVWHELTPEELSVPRGAEMAYTRIHNGTDVNSTFARTNDDKNHAKAAANVTQKLSAVEKEQQQILDRMTRGSQAQERQVQQGPSADYAEAMKDVQSTIDSNTAHGGAKDAVTGEEQARYAARMDMVAGLVPEKNIAKVNHGDLLARSAENADAMAQMHFALINEKKELDVDEIERHKRNAEQVAIEASKNIKIPAEAPKPTGPIFERSSGDGFLPVPEMKPPAPAAPEPKSMTLSMPIVSKTVPINSVRMSEDIQQPAAGGTTPTGLGAPPPFEPRNPNLSMKELALIEENSRLKTELKSFDGEFWEQLEDLKYRYNHLQELVGSEKSESSKFIKGHGAERPTVRPLNPVNRSATMDQYRRSGESGLPLDGVAWAKRNPSRAMDTAALDTPLVQGKHPRAMSGSSVINLNGPGIDANIPGNPQRASYEGTKTVFDSHRGYQDAPNMQKGATQSALHDRGLQERYGSEISSRNAPSRGLPANYTSRDSSKPVPSSSAAIGGSGSQRLPIMRHVSGGYPSGPLYGEKESNSGSLASMCERKLLFELGNHPNPEHASQTLIHRIVDVAARAGNQGRYLTPPQLVECMASVGLRMSANEVTMFAAGFGSDGKGGVDCEEICEALQALLYNFVGEHDRLSGHRMERAGELEAEDSLEKELLGLLMVVADNALAHDKKAVLGAGRNVFDTLIDPFIRADTVRSGVLTFSLWTQIMGDIGCLMLPDELKKLGSYFQVGHAPSKHPENDNEIAIYREKKIKSMLSGAAKADERFASWLASSDTGLGLEDIDEPLIAYQPLCVKLAAVIEDQIENGGGMVAGPGMSKGGSKEVDSVLNGLWMLREFELIENLICQLELMKPNDRRRCLMSLQYALAAADNNNDGTVDGFSLLSALLGAGFRLQRLNRVRLLKAVEELGGKMDYSELCQVLLRSSAEWTSEERTLVNKILKSMGITVLERRAWLGRLRVALMTACVDYNKKQTALKANTLSAYTGESNANSEAQDPGIPPSNFLYVLRDCGIVLSVEEEATLLDCLDTERLAELGALERKKKEKTVVTNQTFGAWGVPMVYYKSFLAFCSRHTGDWSDAAPETTTAVMNMIKATSDPMKGLHEFASLLQAFDEGKTSKVGNRAFQIVCHRARLFANLSENDIRSLSDILTAEGGGKIAYTSFLIHLRVMIAKAMADTNTDVPDIAEQLLANATDSKNTLLPLRNWLLRHTDVESCKLSLKELNALLREFSVLYRPDDLQALLMEMGSEGPSQDSESRTESLANDIDMRDLFRHLFKVRGPWMNTQPYLCNRMVRAMTMTGATLFTTAPGEAPNAQDNNKGANAMAYPKGPRGIETAAARRLLARLRAFTEISSFDGAASGSSGVSAGGGEGRMVDLDIFGAISKACGIPLSDEELLVLADSTDFHPLANRIRCDVVLEAIAFENTSTGAVEGEGEKKSKKSLMDTELSEAATFAIKHLKEQIWKTCKRLKRNADEWINDVNAVFRGFDNGGVGFITTDDFTMALALLNAPCNAEILRDIPSVPEGPGMVSYIDILEALLVPPASMVKSSGTTKGMGEVHKASAGSQENKRPDSADRQSSNTSSSAVSGLNGKKGSKLTQAEKDQQEREYAVNMLVNVIRKSMKTFIINDHSLEEAWMCIVRAFKRFDSNESGKVSPRDFCLAVSILLEGDEVLLTESQWTDIIQYFTEIAANKKDKKDTSTALGAPPIASQLVDYMAFAGKVLDTAECKKIQLNARMVGARNKK